MKWPLSMKKKTEVVIQEVEERSDSIISIQKNWNQSFQVSLMQNDITKEMALEIPCVSSCINRIASIIASLPIRMYQKTKDGITEIEEDNRLYLLNRDTEDKLTSMEFWKAIITDYFLGKGGYAYINKRGTSYISLHYVDESKVTVLPSVDPIFKSNQIYINGTEYKDFELLKVLRNSKNGASGKSILSDNKLILLVAYFAIQYEKSAMKKGGGKKGFLTSERELSKDAIDQLKDDFNKLYDNNSEERVVVLNRGISYQDATSTAVDLQMNQNKESNITQVSMIFDTPASIVKGTASEQDEKRFIEDAINPLINVIEAALDRDLLTEQEKHKGLYYAFDTRELSRGNIKERYEAYEIALRNNFMQIDEVRNQEDLPDLGFNWITLGLQHVLLNPNTMEVYTPNTNQLQKLSKSILKGGEENNEN